MREFQAVEAVLMMCSVLGGAVMNIKIKSEALSRIAAASLVAAGLMLSGCSNNSGGGGSGSSGGASSGASSSGSGSSGAASSSSSSGGASSSSGSGSSGASSSGGSTVSAGVSIELVPSSVTPGQSFQLIYTVPGAGSGGTSCTATNAAGDSNWSGTVAATGGTRTLVAPAAGNIYIYSISCSIAGSTETAQASLFDGVAAAIPSDCGVTNSAGAAVPTQDLIAPDASVGTGNGGLCLGCSVSNPGNVVDQDVLNYATINTPVGLVANETLTVTSAANTYAAGHLVGFVASNPAELLTLNLLQSVTISTFLDGVTQDTAGATASAPLRLDLLTLLASPKSAFIGFTATKPFNAVQLADGSLVSALGQVNVYTACVSTQPVTVGSSSSSSGGSGSSSSSSSSSSGSSSSSSSSSGSGSSSGVSSSSGSSSGGGSSSSGSSSSGGSSSSSGAASYDWSQLGTTLDSYVSSASSVPSGMVSGYSFVLYNKTGTLYSRAGGNQTAGSALTLASASKMPSAAAILTLVDSGKLNLDTPVAAYLAGSGVIWPADKLRITMRMLLSHTSGLPGLGDSTNPTCINQETGTTLAQCAQTVANTALVSQPGAEFNYGGADYQVAGYIATVLSKQDWETFFTAAIAQPLGLTTFTYGPSNFVTNPRIAGGALSDVADYAAILQMLQNKGLFNGKQVLSAAAVADLETNEIQGLPEAFTPFPFGQARNYPGYGLGLWISSPSLYPGSTGPEFSDPGLYGTIPWIDNGLGYGAIILINQDVPTGLAMWNAARPLIINQLVANGG